MRFDRCFSRHSSSCTSERHPVTDPAQNDCASENLSSKAVVDGNLVTGPASTAHPAWLARFLEVLEKHMAG
jgi:putative intracellular protease/amidase